MRKADVFEAGAWPAYDPLELVPVRARVAARSGSAMRVSPPAGLLFETRERVEELNFWGPRGGVGQVALLLPEGTYEVAAEPGSTRPGAVWKVEVSLPRLVRVPVPRLPGVELTIRAGTADEFILRERAYAELTFRPGDVLYDLGAHVGKVTARAMAEGCDRALCYEPEPLTAALLRENVRDWNVEVREEAVVPVRHGPVNLYVSAVGRARGAVSTAMASTVKRRDRLPVTVASTAWMDVMKRASEDECTVLKVDVEKIEMRFDWSLVPRSVREIAVEWDTGWRPPPATRSVVDNCQSALIRAGYECVASSTGFTTTEVWRQRTG